MTADTDAVLLHFDDEAAFAQRLAGAAGLRLLAVARHRFPDGELRLTLPPALPAKAVLLRSLHDPNEKLVELMIAAGAARDLGVRDLTLVAPYLAYMRQDVAFAPGEAVSQKIVGRWLAQAFDAVVTVDPHLHRIARLDEAVPSPAAVALSAAPLIGRFLAQRPDPASLLVGPDEESAQWVASAAEAGGFDWHVCRKTRRGDRDVRIDGPAGDLRGRAVVLVDDVASTGNSLAQAAQALRAAGVARVDAAVTHALPVDDAATTLRAAGVGTLWSCDTVAHPSNAISVAPLIAEALQGLLRG